MDIQKIIERYFCFPEDYPSDRIKIDHYSWSKNSIYRYFEKDVINSRLIRSVETAIENEFLKWDDEATKRFVIEGFGLMRIDNNIPSCDAWENPRDFDTMAITSLQSLIRDNPNFDIMDIVSYVESKFLEAKSQKDIVQAQVFERILYELNECSLSEFVELKCATLVGEKYK